MQNYYGMAIRQNKNNLYSMKKATCAILWHCTDFKDKKFRHRFCPKSEDSWCKYHKDPSNYKPSVNLAKWIHDLCLPIFKALSDDELLKKCLHGNTQNPNESINSIIWSKCPKAIYVSKTVLEIGTCSAILEFNDGSYGVKSVLNYFGIRSGICFEILCESRDNDRIRKGARKSSDEGKCRRKRLRAVKKGLIDKEEQNEQKTYVPGGFT